MVLTTWTSWKSKKYNGNDDVTKKYVIMTKEKFKEILSYISNAIRGTEYENHVFAVGGSVTFYVFVFLWMSLS